jgi:hypothetical protein
MQEGRRGWVTSPLSNLNVAIRGVPGPAILRVSYVSSAMDMLSEAPTDEELKGRISQFNEEATVLLRDLRQRAGIQSLA